MKAAIVFSPSVWDPSFDYFAALVPELAEGHPGLPIPIEKDSEMAKQLEQYHKTDAF